MKILQLPPEIRWKTWIYEFLNSILLGWKSIKTMQFYACAIFKLENRLFKNEVKHKPKWSFANLKIIICMYFFQWFWTTYFESKILDIYKTALVLFIFMEVKSSRRKEESNSSRGSRSATRTDIAVEGLATCFHRFSMIINRKQVAILGSRELPSYLLSNGLVHDQLKAGGNPWI